MFDSRPKELLEYLVRSLVNEKDSVIVEAKETDKGVVLELRVPKEEIGKVIGRQGRVARALRTLVKASSVHSGQKTMVDIVD